MNITQVFEKVPTQKDCIACRTAFSVTVGTIFHHTHMPLQKWCLEHFRI